MIQNRCIPDNEPRLRMVYWCLLLGLLRYLECTHHAYSPKIGMNTEWQFWRDEVQQSMHKSRNVSPHQYGNKSAKTCETIEFPARAGIRICDHWTLDMCFEVWFEKSDVLVDLFWPSETFEHFIIGKKSYHVTISSRERVLALAHSAEPFVLIHWSDARMTHENGNWHTLRTPALQCHSWHTTHYCMMMYDEFLNHMIHQRHLKHPAVRLNRKKLYLIESA